MWRSSWRVVARDVACLVLPGAAFIWEALKDKPSVELLILYMVFLTVPGAAGAVFLARHGGGTVQPPSESPRPPVSSPSQSSSSSPGADR